MKLQAYIQCLRECSDDLTLTNEWGIYDNYEILLSTSPQETTRFLEGHPLFRKRPANDFSEEEYGVPDHFFYVPGTVLAVVREGLGLAISTKIQGQKRAKKDFEKMTSLYHSNLLLVPRQDLYNGGINMQDHSYRQATALAVCDLGEALLEKRIAACFPKVGWNHNGHRGKPLHLSRIVYNDP